MQNMDIAELFTLHQAQLENLSHSFSQDEDLLEQHTATLQPLSFAVSPEDSDFIPPHAIHVLWGKDAAQKGLEVTGQITPLPDQPPLAVLRAVGVLPASDATADIIEQINQTRSQLQALLSPMNRHARSQLLKRVGPTPKVILKQLYRHIPLTRSKPSRVNASWVSSGSSSQVILRDELVGQALKLKEAAELGGRTTDFMVKDIQKILAYGPLQEFTIKRPTRPHVRYNLFMADGSRSSMPGHLPLFYVPGPSPVSYRWLATHPPAASTTDNEKPGDWLVEWMGVKRP